MADLILEIDTKTLAATHARCFPDQPWSAREIELLVEGGAFALSEPGGFILARVAADEAEILTLAVDPERRRQGIGLSLIRAACHKAERLGAAMIFLEVAVDNDAALAVYTRARFEPVAIRPHYYARPGGTAVDAQVLERLLNRGEP